MLGFVNFGDGEMLNLSDDLKIEAVYQTPIVCCMNKESGYDDYQTITKERLQPGAMISVGFSKKAEMHVENCFEKLNINKTHRIS